ELGERFRRHQVRTGVHRAAVVPPVPGAPDAGLPLVAVHLKAVLLEVLDRRKAAGAAADHADRFAAVVYGLPVAPVRRGRRDRIDWVVAHALTPTQRVPSGSGAVAGSATPHPLAADALAAHPCGKGSRLSSP